MEVLSSFFEWFMSLSTIGVIVVVGVGVYVLQQIEKILFRTTSVVLGFIGLAEFYLML